MVYIQEAKSMDRFAPHIKVSESSNVHAHNIKKGKSMCWLIVYTCTRIKGKEQQKEFFMHKIMKGYDINSVAPDIMEIGSIRMEIVES